MRISICKWMEVFWLTFPFFCNRKNKNTKDWIQKKQPEFLPAAD
jgi:hypothetical protein